MTDDDIDYADIPDMGDAEKLWERGLLKKAGEPFFPVIPIDPEVLAWFEAQGKEYQARINAVLRDYMEMKRKGPSQESA
jgi:uncharacterized protein (DUF4415 family)